MRVKGAFERLSRLAETLFRFRYCRYSHPNCRCRCQQTLSHRRWCSERVRRRQLQHWNIAATAPTTEPSHVAGSISSGPSVQEAPSIVRLEEFQLDACQKYWLGLHRTLHSRRSCMHHPCRRIPAAASQMRAGWWLSAEGLLCSKTYPFAEDVLQEMRIGKAFRMVPL